MMELESDLLIKLLFIAGIVFLLWVGQAVLTRFVNQRNIIKYILPFSLGGIYMQNITAVQELLLKMCQ